MADLLDLQARLAAWGAFRPVRQLIGGARNRVWLVRGACGLFVAKSTIRSEAALRWVVEVQTGLQAAGHGVAPYLPSGNDTYVNNGLTLEAHVDGRPGTDADIPALHGVLRDLHQLGQGMGQRPGFASARDLARLDKGGDIDLSAMPRDLVRTCRACWAALPDTQSTLHGDAGLGNVIVTAQGNLMLIDWDEARRDWTGFDFAPSSTADARTMRAALAWEIASCWLREPDRARALAGRLTPPPGPPASI